MKIILSLICSIFIANMSISQTNDISFVSKDRDTLFLVKNDIGISISQIWEISENSEAKPVIIFKPQSWIIDRRKNLKN